MIHSNLDVDLPPPKTDTGDPSVPDALIQRMSGSLAESGRESLVKIESRNGPRVHQESARERISCRAEASARLTVVDAEC